MQRIDERIAAMAANNHGLITHRQARLCGLGRDQIQYRVRSGRWERLTRGVFRLAGSPRTPSQLVLAACLAAADAAVGSHLTAAWSHGLWRSAPPRPHITVPYGSSTRTTLAIVHRARLGPAVSTTKDGVPVTTVARTLVDCAAILPPGLLRAMTNAAFHQHLVTARAIEVAWDHTRRGPGRHGEVNLREAVEPWAGRIQPGSPAEIRLRRLVVSWGFPEPELQVPIVDDEGTTIARADLGWSDRRIGLEYDSATFHGADAWDADNKRHERVARCGWALLHADKADLEPGVRTLAHALARAWAAEPSPTTT